MINKIKIPNTIQSQLPLPETNEFMNTVHGIHTMFMELENVLNIYQQHNAKTHVSLGYKYFEKEVFEHIKKYGTYAPKCSKIKSI